MRKYIIVILQILILIIFLRSSFAQHFFGDVAHTLVGWYESVIHVPERSKIIALRDKFMRNNMSLQPYQVDYVIEMTDSAEQIDSFHDLYCIKGEINPYMFGENLTKLCADIRGSGLLTEDVH